MKRTWKFLLTTIVLFNLLIAPIGTADAKMKTPISANSKVLILNRAIASWKAGIPAGEKRPVTVFLPGWGGAGNVNAFVSAQNTNLVNQGYVTLAIGFDDLGGWTSNIDLKTKLGLDKLCADATIPANCNAIVLDGESYGAAQNYWVVEYLRSHGYSGKVLGFVSEDGGYGAPGNITNPVTGAFTRTGLANTAAYSVAMIENLGDATFPVDDCTWGNCGARTLADAHQARGDGNVFSICPPGGSHGDHSFVNWNAWVISAIKTIIHVVNGVPTFSGYTAPTLSVSNACATATSATVNLIIDVAANHKPISPYIYGLNFAKPAFATEIGLPVRRWGGNTFLRYNWQTGNANTALDWYFENVQVSNAFDWNTPETHDTWIAQNELTNTDSIITIPMLGYVAKDAASCGFSIAKYGAQQDQDVWRPDCGNGKDTLGAAITSNDPLDTSIAAPPSFMQNWVADMVANHGAANSGGVKFYNLDNEPELWSDTHRDVHPAAQTYQELYDKTVAYASAVKTEDPSAQTLGYVSYGWTGYWYSQHDAETAASKNYVCPTMADCYPDYASHGNKYQAEWYLAQMHQYEVDNGIRLLDYFDLHYYPSNGVDLTTVGDAAMQALRLRTTRSLWDPTYIDESWIGGADQAVRQVNLIPRMHGWVDANYPGTKLAITEYNFGGLEDINGALVQADALGIFGREGVDLAALWNYPLPANDPLQYNVFETLPGAYAFRIYRNYDGAGGKFGETSVSAVSADQSKLAVYAAQRTADNALTLVVVNKTANDISSAVSLANFGVTTNAQVYRYSAANLNAILRLADQPVTGAGFASTFPLNSITLVVIPAAPTLQITFKSAGAQDGWILESGENTNAGGTLNATATTFNLGDAAANKQYRGILSFNTGTLNDAAVITKVTLKIRRPATAYLVGNNNPFTWGLGLKADVCKNFFGSALGLQLGDFNFNNLANCKLLAGTFVNAPIANWYSANILNAAFAKINKVGWTQFRLRFAKDDNNDSLADYLKFFSGDAGLTNAPQLIVQYYVP